MSKSDQPRSKSASLLERLPWVGEKNEADADIPYPNPAKIAATWTPDTLVQSGRTPTRGFGGRIFFYDEKSRPVPVEGTLIVHGFDEEIKDPKKSVKRFEFTPEQFTQHFSKTDLGASYSVWIPWDAVGGDKKRISLIASFKTAEGKTIQGVSAMIVLPGKERTPTAEERISKLSPQFRDYQQALAMNDTNNPSGLTTTTIQRRRRSFERPTTTTPGVMPTAADNPMIAGATQTPSVEISMNQRPIASGILPASAEIPKGKRLPTVQHSFQK